MAHNPTPEQDAIITAFRLGSASVMANAGAGCAKTSTSVMGVNAMPPTKGLGIAFNKKIADELRTKFPGDWTLKTLNGLGHSAWGKAIGKGLTLDDRKLGKIINELAKEWNQKLGQDEWIAVRSLVSAAMNQGLVPNEYPHQSLVDDTPDNWAAIAADQWIELPNPGLLDFARAVLIQSVRQAFQGVISFDDQIYMSAMFNGVFWKHPVVLIDEAQDLSPLNHIQLARSASDRIFAIGDPRQAIYAFRGADSKSMQKILGLRKDWQQLPLNTTFRCPKAIVARQQGHYPGYTAAESNIEGRIVNLRQHSPWGYAQIEQELALIEAAGRVATIAILCRNNAPLVKMAFRLIRQGKGVHMLGRDIGKGLIALSKKICPEDGTPIASTVAKIRDWADNQIAIAMANADEGKAEKLRDQSESLMAVVDSASPQDAGALRARLQDLFGREAGRITLSSGHRAKGLEWQLVIHLDPWRLPSRFAQDRADNGDTRQLEQEHNLKYVIDTRAQHTLLTASVEDFR